MSPVPIRITCRTRPQRAAWQPAFRGFTLIEVLVVVAIIALLISILLPSLSAARRQARVVACSSNMAQLSRGIIMYTHDSSGQYAPHLANYPNQVQFQREMRPFPDFRKLLYERFAMKQAGAIWCPLIDSHYNIQPRYSQTLGDIEDDTKWSKIFFVAVSNSAGVSYGGNPSYMSGYAIFAGLASNPNPRASEPQTYTKSWSWEDSGNLDRKRSPHKAGNTRDVIIADVNESWPTQGYGTPLNPYRTFHAKSRELDPAVPSTIRRFVDSNVGFGDGSVVTRNSPKHYIGRDGRGSNATGCYAY